MFASNSPYIILLIGSVLGIFVLLIFPFIKQARTIAPSTERNTEKRILPFIEIHQSLSITSEQESTIESREKLKQKIEGFKNRNPFYGL